MQNIGGQKLEEYSDYVNKLKWFAYIDKKRHEDNIINEITYKYGEDATIVIGDWSQTDHIKGMRQPNVGLKRLLSKRFEVYLIDEYNTSKLNYSTKEEMKHLKVTTQYKDKGGKKQKYSRELYSVLTYKMENGNIGCINRDYNAVLNMKLIVESIINGNGRPKEYCRPKQRANKIKKSGNPGSNSGVKCLNAQRFLGGL